MKKFLLISLIVFSFAMLSAKVVNKIVNVPGMVTYQQAVNYCRSINMRLVNTVEIQFILAGSSSCSPVTFIGGNNQTVSVGSNCQPIEFGSGKENTTYHAMCVGKK